MGEVIYLFPDRDLHVQHDDDGWNLDIDPLPLGNAQSALILFVRQQKSKETQRNYRREIERLFRWSNQIAKKHFCDLKPTDYERYGKFIANPPKSWCGNHTLSRMKSERAPFNGALSVNSQRTSFAVISSFLSFLVKYRYLKTFPMFKINVIDTPNETTMREAIAQRQLNDTQLKSLLQYLYSQTDFDGIRMRFFVSLGLLLGLRITEIAKGVMSDFFQSDGVWLYRVLGKGNKLAHIDVPKKLLEELVLYRTKTLNCADLPDTHDHRPFFNVGARRLSELFKRSVSAASESLPAGRLKEDMQHCTAHWLRHMYIKKLKKNQTSDEDVMRLGRHERRDTSDLYNDSRNAAVRDLTFDDVL